MLLPTCVQLLHAAHTFDVSVLYVHVVFDDKHAMHLGGGGGGGVTPILLIYIYIKKYIIIEFSFLGFLVSIPTWFV